MKVFGDKVLCVGSGAGRVLRPEALLVLLVLLLVLLLAAAASLSLTILLADKVLCVQQAGGARGRGARAAP